MNALFYISLVIWLGFAIHSIVNKKRVVGLNLIVLLGIYFPMLLFSMGWSTYIDRQVSDDFYLIFLYLNIALIVFNATVKDHVDFDKEALDCGVNEGVALGLNFFFIAAYLLENYAGSGMLAPSLHGVDIHKFSLPVVNYITNALSAFALLDVFIFLKSKKKRYLGFLLVVIAMPIATRNSRMTSFVALFQCCFAMACFYNRKQLGQSLLSIIGRIKLRTIGIGVVVAVVIFAAVSISTSVGLKRSSINRTEKYSYGAEIGYGGPFADSEVASTYYGYFPMSFNNLNLSIKYGSTDLNYLGFDTYQGLYFGLLQFDNIFDLEFNASTNHGRVSALNESTVATGFWNFYYDYGKLAFIPIFVMTLLCALITKQTQRSPSKYSYFLYLYFIPLVFFQSFQNEFFGVNTLVTVALAFIFLKITFSKGKAGAKGLNSSVETSTR